MLECILFHSQSSKYRRANVTYHPFIYKDATWILPEATVEFRQSLDEHGKGMSSLACSSTYLNSNTVKIWGTVIGNLAHLLVSTGKYTKQKKQTTSVFLEKQRELTLPVHLVHAPNF